MNSMGARDVAAKTQSMMTSVVTVDLVPMRRMDSAVVSAHCRGSGRVTQFLSGQARIQGGAKMRNAEFKAKRAVHKV